MISLIVVVVQITGQEAINGYGINRQVGNEFSLDGPVKALKVGIVIWPSDPAVPVSNLNPFGKVLAEFRPIVSLDAFKSKGSFSLRQL